MAAWPWLTAHGSLSRCLRCCCRVRLCVRGLFKQVAYLLVGRLRKVLVPGANSVKLFWSDDRDQLVYPRPKLLTRCGCSNWDSNNNAGGLSLSHCGDSGTHRRPGRNAIIDEDDGPVMYLRGGTVSPVEAFPSLHLVLLPVSYTHLRAHETRHDLVCRLLLE